MTVPSISIWTVPDIHQCITLTRDWILMMHNFWFYTAHLKACLGLLGGNPLRKLIKNGNFSSMIAWLWVNFDCMVKVQIWGEMSNLRKCTCICPSK